jgi:hypothetical protein
MKNNKYLFNTLLTAVLFAVMAVYMVLRLVQPPVILLPLNIPNMVLICLIALVAEYYIAPGNARCYICIPVFSALSFGILPLMAGFACQHTFWKLGLVGGAVCTVTTWLFTSMTDRLLSGPKAKTAAFLSAFGLYLAAQCLAGIIL